MSEYEPSGSSEITQEQGDKILSFVLVDMADQLNQADAYTFDSETYPELQDYQDVTVRVDDDSINFILHYTKDYEEFFDTFTYYPELKQLDMREKYTLETLQHLVDMRKAIALRMNTLLINMKGRIIGLAATNEAIKAVWDEYKLIRNNIDSSRAALSKDQKLELEILKHSKEANKLEFIFLVEMAQEIDAPFGEMLREYDTLTRNESLVDEQVATVYKVSYPQTGDPKTLLKTIGMLASIIDNRKQKDSGSDNEPVV